MLAPTDRLQPKVSGTTRRHSVAGATTVGDFGMSAGMCSPKSSLTDIRGAPPAPVAVALSRTSHPPWPQARRTRQPLCPVGLSAATNHPGPPQKGHPQQPRLELVRLPSPAAPHRDSAALRCVRLTAAAATLGGVSDDTFDADGLGQENSPRFGSIVLPPHMQVICGDIARPSHPPLFYAPPICLPIFVDLPVMPLLRLPPFVDCRGRTCPSVGSAVSPSRAGEARRLHFRLLPKETKQDSRTGPTVSLVPCSPTLRPVSV